MYGLHSTNATPEPGCDRQPRSKKKRSTGDARFPYWRIAQIERVIVGIYGEARLPDDDDGRRFVQVVAHHHAQTNHMERIRPWARRWLPEMTAAELDALITDIVGIVAERGIEATYWGADELAVFVGLDDATRSKLRRITTIGANDCLKAEREERSSIRKSDGKRAKRAADGATPRSQSITATKQWIEDGYSCRRTWERHGKRPRVANTAPAVEKEDILGPNLRHARPIHKPGVEIEAPASPRSPVHCQAPSSIDPQERKAVVSETTAGAEPMSAPTRLQLQERARLHLQEVVANMMGSDDPAIWQPLLIAATSDWRGHNLLDDDERVLAGPRPGAGAPW
jgi:hypothetical protein